MSKIPVEISETLVFDTGKEFIVILKPENSTRVLPITIGQLEAQSIVIALNNVQPPRPLTHDLLKQTIDSLKASVSRIEIYALHEDTFYAKLFITNEHGEQVLDSRPSDAIALAVRYACPVFVESDLLERAGGYIKEDLPESEQTELESNTLDSLKHRLAAAIREERYEDAARVRDEINRLSASN